MKLHDDFIGLIKTALFGYVSQSPTLKIKGFRRWEVVKLTNLMGKGPATAKHCKVGIIIIIIIINYTSIALNTMFLSAYGELHVSHILSSPIGFC